jgi:hypothetical protein
MDFIMPFIVSPVKSVCFVNSMCLHSLVYFVKRAAKYFPLSCIIIISFLQIYFVH